jgi:carotenoid cleavage dioxygenase-like enzyme
MADSRRTCVAGSGGISTKVAEREIAHFPTVNTHAAGNDLRPNFYVTFRAGTRIFERVETVPRSLLFVMNQTENGRSSSCRIGAHARGTD